MESFMRRTLQVIQEEKWGVLAAIASGVMYFLGFCGFGIDYFVWVCLVPWLIWYAWRKPSGRLAFYTGWLTGFTAHLGGYHWITYMLENFGHLPPPLAYFLYALLCAAQSSLFGFWGYLTQWFERRQLPLWLSATATMPVLEWLNPAIFPSYLANGLYKRLVLIQSAELWGIIGLTCLVMLSNCALAALIRTGLKFNPPDRKQLIAVTSSTLLLFALNYGWGSVRLDGTTSLLNEPQLKERALNIGTVQSNMGIFEKRQQPTEGHRRHLSLSRELEAQGADLIVWPESGYFFPLRRGRTNLKARVSQDLSTPLIFGGVSFDRDKDGQNQKIWNTAYLIDSAGEVLGTYDKTYLLAFGEYIPFGDWFPFLYKLSPNTGSFTRGDHTKPLVHNDIKYGILICYEDILPNFVLDVMGHKPDILINITNDAWFGDTHEPIIHLALSVFRSVEHRRYLVRSTNTGISAFISPTGEITHQTGTFTQETLMAEVLPLTHETLYSRYGNWLGWLLLIALTFFGLRQRQSITST
jgi:apolipoprotein N-acyltransferase